MECLLGMACKDFVILASDMTNAYSIIVNKQGKTKFEPTKRLIFP